MENQQKQALWADAPRVGPGQGRRNSIADLVELNRCMQDGKSGQHARHRFSKRCLAQSDSRCPWPGPTRERLGGTRTNFCDPGTDENTRLDVIPAKAGIHSAILYDCRNKLDPLLQGDDAVVGAMKPHLRKDDAVMDGTPANQQASLFQL